MIAKRSKNERSELRGKLETTEEEEDSLEVNIFVMPNFQTRILSVAQDDQPPLEPFEVVLTGDFNEAMI